MTSPLSREDARIIVGRIREENGGISREDRAACPPAALRALENVRRKLGSATKTLATNLYSKDTRFVYELIQNAEDNSYSNIQVPGGLLIPYVSFSVYPDRIVIDSNEDGFQEKHVQAICSTGESTKSATQGAQGYIGEKGIGFKSVFKVAKKVHIQSGPFSFSFEHMRDSTDDGLGMVTPLDERFEELPANVRTRLTLTLLDPSRFQDRVQDLTNIPDTLLMFLTKLKIITINAYPRDGSPTNVILVHRSFSTPWEVVIKTTGIGKALRQASKSFYVVRKEVNDLPHDEARQNINSASVVLAFPLSEEKVPMVEQQHVFAFLPLRRAGFSFLIQADFVTQASREDVFHSERNRALLTGIACAFRDAVLKFNDHQTLKYQWMRWLPSESISDEFWKSLRPLIVDLLGKTPCVIPWSGRGLAVPRQLHRIPEIFKDQSGEPLFVDLDIESYLCPKYGFEDFQALKPLGAQILSWRMGLARVEADLARIDSKMKAQTTDRDWHTRVAKLLLQGYAACDYNIERIKSLKMIPLQNGEWVSVQNQTIYFPTTGQTPVPTDLGLLLVQPEAIENSDRNTLLLTLGVEYAKPSTVISLIIRRYRSGCTGCTLADNVSHLQYLYWNLPSDTITLDESIFLVSSNFDRIERGTLCTAHTYFEEQDEEYGPHQLFQAHPQACPAAPGLIVQFIHQDCFRAVPPSVVHHGRSWKQWLSMMAGVQIHPQIRSKRSAVLSRDFSYIIEHRRDKLLGLLRCYWSAYEPLINPSIGEALRKCSATLQTAVLVAELGHTYLPFRSLRTLVSELGIQDFPFLLLLEDQLAEEGTEWLFLTRFGVGTNSDTDRFRFYVECLNMLAIENTNECTPATLNALFAIYTGISRNCSTPDKVSVVGSNFKEEQYIYIPSNSEHEPAWVVAGQCVWAAPEWLQSKKRLQGIARYLSQEHLFRVILKIPDATWNDYFEDLKLLRASTSGKPQTVVEIYRHLWREFQQDSGWQIIRTAFEESELVFVPSSNTWHPPSQCIWAEDNITIPRKVPMKTPYGELQEFFCRILDVSKPDLSMHVQALKELALTRPSPSAKAVQERIKLISSMSPTVSNLQSLKRSKVFSVKITSGQLAFADSLADFAIPDRLEYRDAFSKKIQMLDYSLEDVRACRPFLLAMNLQRKHLSQLVEETTTVADSVIDNELTKNLREKSYALFRCSVHFRSSKSRDEDRSLYEKLLGASVYLSDGISKSISVLQYGETVTVGNSRAIFHLQENEQGLHLYVPRDEGSREECSYRQLPRRLMAYLGISDPTAESLISGIVACRILVAVDGILKDAGIIEVEGITRHDAGIIEVEGITRHADLPPPNRASDFGEFAHSAESQDERTSLTSPSGRSTPSSTTVSSTTVVNAGSERGALSRTSGLFGDETERLRSYPVLGSQLAPPIEQSSTRSDNLRDTNYASLIERVIRCATTLTIPDCGSLSLDYSLSDFFLPSVFTDRTSEWDRIGAAGELLVYEMLLKDGLPGFSHFNWASTMRKEVGVHPKYSSLQPWIGSETSDITYQDSRSVLTALLIRKGYLDASVWALSDPTYYIEVKTTVRNFAERFYMSGAQYDRMQRYKLHPGTPVPNIYVIFRVFNLEGRIGLRVYVDPETCRSQGQLEFTTDKWAVKPTG